MPEMRGHWTNPLMNQSRPLGPSGTDSPQTPQGHGVLPGLPRGQHTRPSLWLCMRHRHLILEMHFWKKHFQWGKPSGNILLLKGSPKLCIIYSLMHSSLMRPLLAFLFHKHLPSPSQHGGLWLVICCLYKASPTHHLDLCCRGSRCIFAFQRPVGDPLTGIPGLSPSVHSASRGELGETPSATPATTAGGRGHSAEAGS